MKCIILTKMLCVLFNLKGKNVKLTLKNSSMLLRKNFKYKKIKYV